MKRILIIRLSAIGDIVMASALIPALRRRWPDAHIAWLAEPAGAELLRDNPRLDEVILWPRGEWSQLWRERRYRTLLERARRFASGLRARRFDLALDTQGLLKSGLWAWFSGARVRIGLHSREGSALLMTEVLRPPGLDERIGSEYLFLARRLGAGTDGFPMDLALGAGCRAEARALLEAQGISGGYAVIAPFTTRAQKHWIEARWVELARRIGTDPGLDVVLLGGPDDRAAAGRIAAGGGIHNLVGRARLAASAALVSGARLLVGVDTGLTHMGIALNVPTVALFGSTRPYLDTASPRARVLYHPMACSPCRRRPTCGGAFTCMALHSVESVLATARLLLEEAR